MAVIENRTTLEGDILIIKPQIPRVGLLSLLNFTDQTAGETQSNYFKKFFRYSINGGLFFTEWLPLTNANIMSVQVQQTNTFVIEMKYERVGSVGNVAFENILLNGEFEKLKYPYYDKTPFAKFFDIKDINVFGWALNVLEKIYGTSILPDYIVRKKEDSLSEDEDFISFWNSITEFFAVLVYYARQFEDIRSNRELLAEYIKQQGIYLCNDINLTDLLIINKNLFKEFEQRGTRRIVEKGDGFNIVNGELLRLICYKEYEEFLFSLTKRGEVGWCIGRSSPMYQGTENIINLNKSYEKGVIEDLNKYPLTRNEDISIERLDIQEKSNFELVKNGSFLLDSKYWEKSSTANVEILTVDGKLCAKVGDLNIVSQSLFQNIYNDKIWEVTFWAREGTIDSIAVYRDNEVSTIVDITPTWTKYSVLLYTQNTSSFIDDQSILRQDPDKFFFITDISAKQWGFSKNVIKVESQGNLAGIGDYLFRDKIIPIEPTLDYEISFRIMTLDNVADLNFGLIGYNIDKIKIEGFKSKKDGSDTDFFFTSQKIPNVRHSYLVRGILYNKNSSIDSLDKMSIGFGNNLILKDGVEYIMPVIQNLNSTIYIYDLEIKPLRLPCSRGVLSSKNFTFIYAKNNSENSNKKNERIINKELIPYNQFIKSKWL